MKDSARSAIYLANRIFPKRFSGRVLEFVRANVASSDQGKCLPDKTRLY